MTEKQKNLESVKDSAILLLKKKQRVRHGKSEMGLSPSSKGPTLNISVVVRQQTSDEQHRFKTATDALLMELVRQQLGRRSI